MSGNFESEERTAWNALAASFRRGLAETSGEVPPMGFATAVVARWSENRAHWEYGVLEWISIRLALVTSVAALAVWAGWFWSSRSAAGEEWMDLPPLENVVL
jgi:hypothetical protein